MKRKAEDLGYELKEIDLLEGKDYSAKPCNVWLTARLDNDCAAQIRSGLEKIRHQFNPKLIDLACKLPLQFKQFCSEVQGFYKKINFWPQSQFS